MLLKLMLWGNRKFRIQDLIWADFLKDTQVDNGGLSLWSAGTLFINGGRSLQSARTLLTGSGRSLWPAGTLVYQWWAEPLVSWNFAAGWFLLTLSQTFILVITDWFLLLQQPADINGCCDFRFCSNSSANFDPSEPCQPLTETQDKCLRPPDRCFTAAFSSTSVYRPSWFISL